MHGVDGCSGDQHEHLASWACHGLMGTAPSFQSCACACVSDETDYCFANGAGQGGGVITSHGAWRTKSNTGMALPGPQAQRHRAQDGGGSMHAPVPIRPASGPRRAHCTHARSPPRERHCVCVSFRWCSPSPSCIDIDSSRCFTQKSKRRFSYYERFASVHGRRLPVVG